MNSVSPHHHPHHNSALSMQRRPPDDLGRLFSSAHSILEQPPPPTLREILSAYRAKGDGDRDMLLAMLNAKTAEDQRLASLTSLHRTMLEIYQQTPPTSEPSHSSSRHSISGAYHYPTPTFTTSPRAYDQPQSRRSHHRHRVASGGSRSPPPSRVHLHHQSMRDIPLSHHSDHPRKRHRSSHSPHPSHAGIYEPAHHLAEHLPPSPYSSSDRSDSAEYSPRSRASMTIGSLLSSGPSRDMNGDIPQERE
ncbi:hypothetical protein CPB84DRAFT_1749612 [Gymnopilus junonius]|uniref:Uncharacterized protein n=1 Tax=Gymnopilus junonius TaxID=109634 RepID=A0A9P5NI68_GYMJU|nr:hypothetical protein CPB84DRAFT_1749612 [Gymnopilus junonius]